MYDKVETHVRGPQTLEVPTESYGSLLVPILMTKIPEDIRILLGRQIKEDRKPRGKISAQRSFNISSVVGRKKSSAN
jgi:hypothetical protein